MILDVRTRYVEPGITIFEFAGRLSLGNRLTEAEHSLKSTIENGCRKLVLDLSGLDFLDSAGIGLLVMCAGVMGRMGGQLCVSGANARVSQIFEITHLGRIVPIHADAETACRSL